MQVQSLRDSEKELRKYNVAYFMASVDSVEDNRRFAKEQKANFPLLCDISKEVARAFGPLVDYNGNQIARRWTVYIDKEGIVRKIDRAVKPASAGKDMVSSFEELGFEKK